MHMYFSSKHDAGPALHQHWVNVLCIFGLAVTIIFNKAAERRNRTMIIVIKFNPGLFSWKMKVWPCHIGDDETMLF